MAYPTSVDAGFVQFVESQSAPTLSNGNTISTANVGVARVTTSGNVTGIILQQGTTPAQDIFIENESSNTITFASVGTSFVADGTSAVIAANRAMHLRWNSFQSKWYRV